MTNIGDVVLTCPVIDIVRWDFPKARIHLMVGPKAVSLFEANPNFRVKVFDKQAALAEKCSWFWNLCQGHYDCVIDLRRTMLPVFLLPKYGASLRAMLFGSRQSPQEHKKDAHLNRLRQVYDFESLGPKPIAVMTTKQDEQFFEGSIVPVLQGQDFVVIAPGAADSAKRWHPQGFAAVADYLSGTKKIVFVGDAKDAEIVEDIQGRMKASSLSLAGKINLRQVAFVLKKCSWALTHDSGIMHLASYLNVPLLSLWGPTDINKYAPWSSKFVTVRRNEKCIRCQNPNSKGPHHCMSFIKVEDILNEITNNF